MKKRAKNTKLGKLLSLALALMLAASLLPANGLKAKAAAPTLSVSENVIFTGSENINDWSSRWEIPVSDWSVVPAGSQLVITADMLAPEVAIEDYAVFHILNSSWEKVGSLHDLGWNYDGGAGGIQGVSWVVKKYRS